MRGEFHRADGLVIPNNVTSFGAQSLLAAIFTGTPLTPYMGLCSGVYDPALTTASIQEPGPNLGYSRVSMPPDGNHWTVAGQVNGEWYVESIPVVFAATGLGYDVPISRMFLSDGLISPNIYALSGALPTALTLTPATPIEQRTFKYRFYLR